MKWRCWIGLHNWTKWSEPFQETWGKFGMPERVLIAEWIRTFQSRRCQDCRKTDKREVRA